MTERQQYKSIYWAWKSMKQRTLNPKCTAYKNYGARGITVCDKWMTFEPFLDWALSSGWSKGMDIDRIDNDGNYSPDNCRWIDRQANINNRRKTIRVTVDGETKPISEWAEISKIPHGSLKIWFETKGHDYVAGRIKDAIKNGYTPCDYNYNHACQPVINLATGRRYNSVKEAARETGINSGAIWSDLKRNCSKWRKAKA